MKQPVRFCRRDFLRAMASVAAFPTLIPATARGAAGRPAPSERINLGVIGLGDRGSAHTGALLNMGDAQVVAVCDPYRSKAEGWKKRVEDAYGKGRPGGDHQGCAALQDFRELVARPDIDAVVVAAPEYWHALMSIYAMRAGKDVYCEKALSLTVPEGRAMCEAVRRYGRVLQVGTQQRSERNFRFACELARNGYLGKVHTVQVSVAGSRPLPVAAPQAPPPDLDYDLWLGPAPWTPYNDPKCTFNWYFMFDYCIGWIGSWGVHHIDIALWGAPELHASTLEIEGVAEFPAEGLGNTSLNWNVTATPPSGPRLVFTEHKYQKHGVRFIGNQGWVHVVRGGIQAEPEELLEVRLKTTDQHLYESTHHLRNFLECMQTRHDPVSPVEAGHAATTLTAVADIATRLRRKLTWDWKTEQFVNDDAANAMLVRAMRSPWRT